MRECERHGSNQAVCMRDSFAQKGRGELEDLRSCKIGRSPFLVRQANGPFHGRRPFTVTGLARLLGDGVQVPPRRDGSGSVPMGSCRLPDGVLSSRELFSGWE